MISELQQFLDRSFVYRFSHGPHVVGSVEEARQRGINCVSLAHLAVKELFGYKLPSNLLCTELFNDTEHLRRLPVGAVLQVGDLVWLGTATSKVALEDFVPEYDAGGDLLNWSDSPLNHVAVHTGEWRAGEPLLLHSSVEDGTNAIWSLGQFQQHANYQQVYGVSRLRDL